MGFFETFILSLFDTVMTLLLLHSMKKSLNFKITNIVLYIIATSVGIAMVSSFISNDVLSHLLSTLTGIVTLYLYLFLYESKNKISCALFYFTVSLILIVLQLVCIIILLMTVGEVEYTFFNGFIAQILCLILVLLLVKFIPLSLLNMFIEERNPLFSVIITTSFVLYYGITILWYINVSNITTVTLEIIIVVLIAIAINTVILREGFLSRIYKEKLSIYDTYFPIINDMIEELRSKQHDYHNQLQTILAMKKDALTSDKDIEDYILELNSGNIWKDLLKLDNRIISAFIYSKIIEAKKKNIPINLSIHDFHIPSVYSSYHLVEMYGILIDNAIEAVEPMDVNKAMELLIDRVDGMNVFEVRNTYRYVSVTEINNFFSNGYTTKNTGTRGIGLYKLKKLLEEKKGTIDFYYDTEFGQIIARILYF